MVLMASTVMIILNLIVMVKQDQTIHLNQDSHWLE